MRRSLLADGRSLRMPGNPVARSGFTLIELLVVVAVIAVVSGLLLPVLLQAYDRSKKVAAPQTPSKPERLQVDADKPALPSGALPILDSVDLKMTLTSSYHRIGMDVFTRYRVDCAGRVVFRHPGGANEGRVALLIPFPDNILEARDVLLRVLAPGSDEPLPLNDVVYNKRGIYCVCVADRQQPLTEDVSFTALGRDQFDYPLPPARQIRSVSITLNLPGGESRTIPDDSLQPSASAPEQIRWEFKNLVSDRRITVQIPSAQAPLARVLLLSRLVAIAVLLFGAGFWFLSEQAKPGQLDSFRLGHFLLLALTYSLFFIIFAVLEFHGGLGTPVSMAVSAVFSLPLLVFHVSRILDPRFAMTRVVPLAAFTLGLVVNGVYGAAGRDYIFIGAAICIIAYVTLYYPTWAAGREQYHQEKEAAYAARRRALIERITTGLGAQIAELNGADTRTAEYLKSAQAEEMTAARSRLERAREPVSGLSKEYEEFAKRLSYLPDRLSPGSAETCNDLERKANALQDRLEPHLANLQAELATYQSALKSLAAPARKGEVHCLACGQVVPDAPFCQACGAAHPRIVTCEGCGDRMVIPIHLLAEDQQDRTLFCTRCGLRVPPLQAGT